MKKRNNLYHEPLGFVNLKGHQSSPSLNDPLRGSSLRSPAPHEKGLPDLFHESTASAILMQYRPPHDPSNLDYSETLQNSQNLTARGIRIPFVWADRHPVFLERLLYIPGFYDKHQEWAPLSWSDERFFSQNQPVMIEYCSGNGQWICERAEKNPHLNWVAVEKRFDRSRKMWARMQHKKLSNLFIMCGEAHIVTEYYIPKNSLTEVFVNFPDPWPKPRHAKNRLITTSFLQTLALATTVNGKVTFVTDDLTYATQILEELKKSESWTHLIEAPHYTVDLPNYGKSFFADLWTQKGRVIHYIPYTKI